MTGDTAQSARDAAAWVADRLTRQGFCALFAGGCVRDLLMGRTPADYDVATDATPEAVCRLFRRTLKVGVQFGVVIVLVNKFQVEVATFRSESGYADGRHPADVKFSDAKQDALRRDFTINGMFMHPATAEVIDYVGGRDDLARRVLRAIGLPTERFAEDHLRMLRAVRFACVLDFRLDDATATAIRELAPRVNDVSAERIWQEWEKLLSHRNRRAGFDLAAATGLVAALWPAQADRVDAIAARLAQLPPGADAVTALACQLADLPVEQVHAACRELSLDNKRRESAAWLVAHLHHLLDRPLDAVSLKRLLADANWPRLVDASSAMARSADEQSHLADHLSRAAKIPSDRIAPPPLIDGAAVMALGVPEGPRVGQILAAVYDAQLADTLATRDEALAMARRLSERTS